MASDSDPYSPPDKIVAEITDETFRTAVALLDAGAVADLDTQLASHPHLLAARAERPHEPASGYFYRPHLLWFVAENPVRTGRLPANITEVAKLIIDRARAAGVEELPEHIDYTLALVATGRIPRETRQQRNLLTLLVKEGGNPDQVQAALAHGELDAASALLDLGAPWSPQAAAGLGDAPRLATLLSDVWMMDPADPRRSAILSESLSLAAFNGQAECANVLCQAGADPAQFNPEGFHRHCTPLHNAVHAKALDTVKVLIEHGADTTIKDRLWDATPVEWATYLGHEEIATWLREETE